MFIEVSAFHVFAWAEELLDDPTLCAGDGAAADLVRYIRSDETPHVEYLRTAITEVRDRTVRTDRRRRDPRRDVHRRTLDNATAPTRSARAGPQAIELFDREVARALDGVAGGDDILEEFHALADDDLPSRCGAREVRRLLRAPAAAAVGGAQRVPADPGRARADRARRLARHRLRVGGRAPLPRGVLALERARGVPRRGVAAHEAHPPRARHRADAAAVQPSRRASPSGSHARPRVGRARRLRHRRVVVGSRARRLPHRPHAQARDVGGGPARRGAVHERVAVHRSRRRVRHDAAAQRGARSRCRSRIRRCGWRAAGATRSTSRRRRRSARSRSRSSTPKRRATGSTTTTRRSRPKACRSATRSTPTSRA